MRNRSYSLFTEHMHILAKMQLLEQQQYEKRIDYQRRVHAYLQRFQELYGEFSDKIKDEIQKRIDDPKIEKPIGFARDCTSPEPLWRIPIFVAILIISAGWIITLPPWQIGDNSITGLILLLNPNIPSYIELNPINNTIGALGTNSNVFTSSPSLMKIFNVTQTPVTFAFLGAYFHSIQILVQRFFRRDLRINVYVSVSQRIILGIIATWIIFSFLPNLSFLPYISIDEQPLSPIKYMGKLNYIGFIIGAFPAMIWEFLKKSTTNRFSSIIQYHPEVFPLSKLDGINVWNELRFEEEDICNIQNLATANIVDLMLTTKISSERIIYWVDQAILYQTIGFECSNLKADYAYECIISTEKINESPLVNIIHKIKKITPLQTNKNKYLHRKTNIDNLGCVGIRTATSLIEVFRKNKEEEFWTERGYKIQEIQSIITSIETNPNIKLIQSWRELEPYNVGYKWNPKYLYLM